MNTELFNVVSLLVSILAIIIALVGMIASVAKTVKEDDLAVQANKKADEANETAFLFA